jgi:hypothetical protein
MDRDTLRASASTDNTLQGAMMEGGGVLGEHGCYLLVLGAHLVWVGLVEGVFERRGCNPAGTLHAAASTGNTWQGVKWRGGGGGMQGGGGGN